MNKTFLLTNFINLTPLLFNLLIIFLFMHPAKISKFHPLLYMIILISVTFSISLKMNFFFKSWLPFMLFLTMIGGLLVIFMYIVSLSNNELFSINLKNIMNNIFKITPFSFMMLLIYLYIPDLIYFFDLNSSFNNFSLIKDEMNMNLLYKNFFNKSTLFIMLYLYLTMIIIMNICSIYKAPLRQNLFYE